MTVETLRSGELSGQSRSDARLPRRAFADGDAGEIADALGVVAGARGMSQLADETGLTRQALYKALSSDGNPEFATIMKVIRALGFRLYLEPASVACRFARLGGKSKLVNEGVSPYSMIFDISKD